MAAPNVRADRGAVQRLGTVLLVGGLAYLFAALAADGSASLRDVLLRYAFVAAGVFAIAPPHLLLPDRAVGWLQILNPAPRALLGRQGRPWAFTVTAFLVPPVVLAFEIGGGGMDTAARGSCPHRARRWRLRLRTLHGHRAGLAGVAGGAGGRLVPAAGREG